MPESDRPAGTPPPSPAQPGWGAVKEHILANKITFGMFCTRLLTLFFTLNYFLPIFLTHSSQCYSKALMANAATSALRLHQRIPRVQFNRAFLGTIFLEDSAHYVLYSLIFIFGQPLTMALVPCVLFAVLHAASYFLTLLDRMGQQNSFWGARMLISFVEFQSRNSLRMAAFTEIFLMPTVVVFIFVGRTNLFTPFMYYRFLTLRYASRRNPYTRAVFMELRLSLEQAVQSPRIPDGVRTLTHKAIALVSSLAPVYAPEH
ncbi:Krueppel homolog 2-like [Tigriopus californicus]|uniref:Krueppel homolog 2-like n=1 Tax=Tigriopus californicus TaxID=6832 RepID=UPI0027DA7E7D|nr:Krueppel homolog 2-like [Tigriopus californicus]